jgi:tRNA-specific 2-thiouridylase
MSSALVAISGGVDSSVALLRSRGHYDSVRACHLDNGGGPCSEALEVADHLGVELLVLDTSDLFEAEVAGPSRRMSRSGLTPNPCAMCNARVKLAVPSGMLETGEVLVTGHYTLSGPDGPCRGVDGERDQSYFLSLVPGNILDRCSFPLGGSRKRDVRTEAEEACLPFRRKESMDLCFDLWEGRDRGRPGEIVDLERGPVGEHSGIGLFTVGQRKGTGAHGERRFVVTIDPSSGTVFIGSGKDLLCSGCRLEGMNWLATVPAEPFEALVQTRYRRRPSQAVVTPVPGGAAVRFREPERAVAPGQVGALYQGNRLLGGGVIAGVDGFEG